MQQPRPALSSAGKNYILNDVTRASARENARMRTLPRACGLRDHLKGALAPEDDDRRISSASSREQTHSRRASASSLILNPSLQVWDLSEVRSTVAVLVKGHSPEPHTHCGKVDENTCMC